MADGLGLPRFRTRASRMQLIKSPTRFYKAIESIIERAQERVFLSSLYIGKDETDLMDTLKTTLSKRPALRAIVLVDALRSTREGQFRIDPVTRRPNTSCASLLASLTRDFPDQVDVCLYRTSGLPVWLEKLIGKRVVEGAGLQHMKIYGGDNEFIMSGANLSHDYFSNRQDRYVHFWDQPLLSNYLISLILLCGHFSYRLMAAKAVEAGKEHPHHSAYALQWDGSNSQLLLGEADDGTVNEGGCHIAALERQPLREHKFAFDAGKLVNAFTQRWRQHCEEELANYNNTQVTNDEDDDNAAFVVPLLQMGPLNITNETDAMPRIFEALRREGLAADMPGCLDLTSGYFSLHSPYKSLVLDAPSEAFETRIVAAAPESNGFFGSKGISRHIPMAYTWLEQKFWKAVQRRGKERSIELLEWVKSGWTYHAKGIWWTPPRTRALGPTHTLIGSSNFGYRSALRDLECTFLVEAPQSGQSCLTHVLKEEVNDLRHNATVPVNDALFAQDDRKVSWGVRIAAELIKGRL